MLAEATAVVQEERPSKVVSEEVRHPRRTAVVQLPPSPAGAATCLSFLIVSSGVVDSVRGRATGSRFPEAAQCRHTQECKHIRSERRGESF